MASKVSYLNPKGSIIYKILIAILAVALVFSLIYPEKLWKAEEQKTEQCRQNMTHILYAELVYLMETEAYTDTVENAVNLIKNDTTGTLLRMYTNIDSVLSLNILTALKADTLAAAIIDTLNRYGYQHNIDTTSALILDSLKTYDNFARYIDSVALYSLDNLYKCPTTDKEYLITIIDTSAFKEIYINCPLDADDSLAVTNDFVLDKLGGLSITNHGRIDNGSVSWD